MATTQPVVKFTYEDYRTAPADKRYELLGGDLIMVPAPNLRHQEVQFRLSQELGRFILDHELGVCAAGNPDHYMLCKLRRQTATYCARSDPKQFYGADS